MVGYIYLITDTTNGKQYVGQHHYNIEGQLDPNYHGSGHIIKMIYKKRPETLREEYLKTCYSQTELDEWEQYYIEFYNTLYPNGYNLQEGGGGGVPCEETRRKMSNAQKGKPSTFKGKHHSEEARRKLSEAQKKYIGDKAPMYGKHHSEESKKKMSKAKKGIFCGEKHPMFGKHLSEETKKRISESNKGLKSGEKNPFYGKHHSEETKRKISDNKINGKSSKKVLQFDLYGNFIREWPSTSEAQRSGCGYYSSGISLCCQGKQKTHKGFVWKYKD